MLTTSEGGFPKFVINRVTLELQYLSLLTLVSSPQEFWSKFVQPRVAHIQNVSPLNSTNLVRDARQTLDDELDALHLAMCKLRTRRNALSITSCLPPEVLAHIFKFLANAMLPSKWHSSQQARLGWISVTHVCMRWRDTALTHPSLWGYISSALTPRWREAVIARAKSAPLTIHLAYYHSDSNFVAHHAFHTHELFLSGLRQNSLIFQMLTSSAPILEHLSLQSSASTAVILPTNIFAGGTPSLRRITLDGVLLPWSASIFCNLTYLRVNLTRTSGTSLNLPHDSDAASQYDHLFGALARMPALRTLDLAYCLPSRSHSQHPVGHTRTVLPCLQLLSLVGTLVECVDIAKYLRIPSSSRVVLKCSDAPQRTDPGLVHFLEAYISGGAAPRLLTLSISLLRYPFTQSESVNIELWHTRSPSEVAWPSFAPDLFPFISVSFPVSSNSWDLMNGICSVLPLEDLRILKVAYDHDKWSTEAWISIFGRCSLVEHVFVQGQNAVHFCRLLARPASGAVRTATAAADLFFRHLKSLQVYEVDLLNSVEHEGDERPFNELLADWLSTRMEVFMDELEDADGDEYDGESDEDGGDNGQGGGQAERFEEDSRLERLVITQCSVTEEHVDELEDYVQDVVWDEDEGIYKDESEEGSVDGSY